MLLHVSNSEPSFFYFYFTVFNLWKSQTTPLRGCQSRLRNYFKQIAALICLKSCFPSPSNICFPVLSIINTAEMSSSVCGTLAAVFFLRNLAVTCEQPVWNNLTQSAKKKVFQGYFQVSELWLVNWCPFVQGHQKVLISTVLSFSLNDKFACSLKLKKGPSASRLSTVFPFSCVYTAGSHPLHHLVIFQEWSHKCFSPQGKPSIYCSQRLIYAAGSHCETSPMTFENFKDVLEKLWQRKDSYFSPIPLRISIWKEKCWSLLFPDHAESHLLMQCNLSIHVPRELKILAMRSWWIDELGSIKR